MAANTLTSEQKEFIVRKLAAFYTPRDIAQQLAAKFPATKFNENDILANDPRINLLAPEMHTLYSNERERILLDPHSDPYTDQKARLILLSNMVDFYKDSNRIPDARATLKQIAEELGVVGGKAGAGKAADKDADTPGFKAVTVQRSVVRPND